MRDPLTQHVRSLCIGYVWSRHTLRSFLLLPFCSSSSSSSSCFSCRLADRVEAICLSCASTSITPTNSSSSSSFRPLFFLGTRNAQPRLLNAGLGRLGDLEDTQSG